MSWPTKSMAVINVLRSNLFLINKKYKLSDSIGDLFPSSWPHPKSKWLQIPDCSNLEGLPMADKKFEQLRTWWRLRFEDVMAPAPEVLPLMRGVNHRINLIDSNARPIERRATCPQALEDQLREKMACYE